ncbi:DUF4386 domain-containing protein [Nocardioides kongjuensis]|uniref:DUF4386 domain-containing protein n=1 Tax=Nocardioides kongjuensis TaxID=349522 RepID=UPI0035EE637A
MLYLVTHVTSVLALVAYGDGRDPVAVRAGIVLELGLALGCAGTGVLLAQVLSPFGPARAQAFAQLRAVEAAAIVAGTLPMAVVADTGRPTDDLIALHAAAFLLGQGLVIGVNTLVLASLLWSSGFVGRRLAGLGLVGGCLVLASDLAQLFALIPARGAVAAGCAVPIFAFELWFALTLIAGRGRPARASAAATHGELEVPPLGLEPRLGRF